MTLPLLYKGSILFLKVILDYIMINLNKYLSFG